MKQLLFIALVACLTASCGNKKSENQDQTAKTETKVYEVEGLLAVADQMLDTTVTVKGNVTHTCKHSGKKCFIVGENGEISLQVNATGNISSFDKELVGSEVEITGVLKEKRRTKEEIDQMEADAKKALEDGGSAEVCETELNNVTKMREWMKKQNKDYYSIYYIDGEDCKTVGAEDQK